MGPPFERALQLREIIMESKPINEERPLQESYKVAIELLGEVMSPQGITTRLRQRIRDFLSKKTKDCGRDIA